MPNTLAHLGISALVTRSLIGLSDIKWIFLGAVLPDVPFILKRIVIWAVPGVDVLSVRVFSIIQASLAFSLVLAFACSRFSRSPARVFLILGIGVLLHLFLDALQIKWGNGVHLLAPFSWWSLDIGLYWPEQWPSHLMTAFGAGYVVYAFLYQVRDDSSDLTWPNPRNALAMFLATAVYMVAPVTLLDDAEDAGVGSANIGRQANRTGYQMVIDRGPFKHENGELQVQLFEGSFVYLEGVNRELPDRGKISAKGSFIAHDRYYADEYHINNTHFREGASIVGLVSVLLYWLVIFLLTIRFPQASRAN